MFQLAMFARVQSLLERRSVVKQSCINKASGRNAIILFTQASLGCAFIVLNFCECRFLKKNLKTKSVLFLYIEKYHKKTQRRREVEDGTSAD